MTNTLTLDPAADPALCPGGIVTTCLSMVVGRRADGSLYGVVRFPGGRIESEAGDPDLGFDEPNTVLHDAAHAFLAMLLGLERPPVLERVAEVRSLSMQDAALEEVAAFSLQAWAAALRGQDPAPFIENTKAWLVKGGFIEAEV